ncbi:TetR/AcrR family transcriptional regulator [Lentzea sp. NBC_00516]|uniref:TetR/AcrR family transcriptional regulator n=1 Tax=Lentzea sp. NBC_00516 TaxID=2903582 RepID=UPI002E819074|nr:TetR/AcrR family transcriptional regulator [Lentzea sp. NBC_00516]WUD28050.1 TetR/AcrR family transcriptional regulator [Lentzea sp. NBC_00516]
MREEQKQSDVPAKRRELRRDASDNRDRVLSAAAVAVRREGTAVPMATIAADAGVGVGTVYRHYPSREALLNALTHRSLRLVVGAAERAASLDGPGIECVRSFLHQSIEHGTELVLPLHGGPALPDEEALALRADIRRTLTSILKRGERDGTIRSDATPADIVIFGAMITQQLPHIANWKTTALRQVVLYLDGLSPRS